MLTPAQTLLCKSQRDTLTRISCPDAARSLDSCACAYKSGNPFGCAQSARLTANALVGTATPYGESSAAGGSPSAGDWRTRRAIGNARRLTPHSTLPEGVPPTTGRQLFGGSFPRKRALGTPARRCSGHRSGR